MQKTITLLLFILTGNSLFACLSASQNRLFPLGKTSEGLCVVETHLNRTEYREKGKETIEIKPAWGGISFFKIYDKNNKEIYSTTIDTITLFEQVHYDSVINRIFKKGLKLAKAYPDFIAAKPISITFCDYQVACSKAELLYDTLNNKISILLQSNTKHEVSTLFGPTSIASNLLDYYGGFDDADLSAKSFYGSLYISSVRQFQVGNKKLTIAHIGSGQTFELEEGGTYPPRKEYKSKFAFIDLNKSVFEEPVLHHGHGFDLFIWERL
mgnify:CR=1 FL=1